jgi:outer membrane protein OmpA-like peptidoglycan-associated protein
VITGCGAPASTPKIIVIVASATANEPAPVLANQDRAMLRNAGSTSTHAAAFVVDPNTGQAHEVSLTPRRADGEVDYGPERDSELTANVNRVQQLLNVLSADKPFDLLNMISQATHVTPRPGTLLVLSSGVSTSGAFDLRKVGWGANPHTAAASLHRRGQLPSLSGWHVLFSGLADTAGRQPALPVPQRTVLTRYWLTLCHVARAASCAVDSVTRPDPPTQSTTPVPVVRVPRVTSFRGPHGQTTTNVPADAFFAFGSARLLPGADAILRPVAARARAHHLKITILGFASPDGGTNRTNKALSAERARSVRARLLALKVPANLIVRAVGLGTAGKSRSACYRNGHLDETVCAQLRHVKIILHPASAGAS